MVIPLQGERIGPRPLEHHHLGVGELHENLRVLLPQGGPEALTRADEVNGACFVFILLHHSYSFLYFVYRVVQVLVRLVWVRRP